MARRYIPWLALIILAATAGFVYMGRGTPPGTVPADPRQLPPPRAVPPEAQAGLVSLPRVGPPEVQADLVTLLAEVPGDDLAYWRDKPHLAATFGYPLKPSLSATERAAAGRLAAGEFSPHQLFPWTRPGVPPPWDYNPAQSRTYDFYKHALQWLVPLIKQWVCDADADALALTKRCISDWILKNATPPGGSVYAWNDHATSYRTRLFCWFWELWRERAADDPEFARLVLASLHQHATYLTQDKNYSPRSNHGLHMDGSLLAAVVTLPEFRDAAAWRTVAETRLAAYVARNFSADGFNLEQSPAYHWYVFDRLGETAVFLRANDLAVPAAVADVLERAMAVWPYLVRPDAMLPNVGDSGGGTSRSWPARAREHLGHELPPPAPCSIANPRGDGGSFLLSFAAGYAVFTAYPIGESQPATDTYVLFRCNSWHHSGHCHNDALSFELFAYGREWLVDSGRFNYEESTPQRQYMRSARAHNVVLVDDTNFGFHPLELLDSGRTLEGDFVTVRHALPAAWHTRRFEFRPPRAIRLVDTLEARDARLHLYSQLFQVAPNLRVEIVSPREVRLVAPDGRVGLIIQTGDAGVWSAITGQDEPRRQGWYSRAFNQREPITTLFYALARPRERCRFVTEISLRDDSSAGP